jgi:hypothetical protein
MSAASSFYDVRQTILEQHAEIRARMRGLTEYANRTDHWAQQALGILLPRFASHFEEHLAFEERELAPRIRDLDAWGRVREEALLSEHRDQRRRLERACSLVEIPGALEGDSLSDAIYALVDGLLEEMVNEEAALIEMLRIDEYGHAEQITG